MGIFGNKNNQTIAESERYSSDQKIQSNLVLFYLILVFAYSIAIVLLSYQQFINFSSKLPSNFNLLVNNWNENPISQIRLTEISNQSDYSESQIKNFFFYQNVIYKFEVLKYQNYNFMQNYTIETDCQQGFKLCGGVEIDSKYCVLESNDCFFNDIIFANDWISKKKSPIFYQTQNNSNNNVTIFYFSNAQSKSILTNLRYGLNGQVCKDDNQLLNCDDVILNMEEVYNLKNAQEYLQKIFTNLPSNFSKNASISLYGERYVEFHLECRYDLIERVSESSNFYKSLSYVLYIQTLLTLVYCIFIGIILNITHFFMLSDFSFFLTLSLFDQKKIKIIRRIIYTIRFLSFLPFGTIICLLYFYEAQFYDTINRIVKENCIQSDLQYILIELISEIENFRAKQIAVFWIFIVALIVEILAGFIIVYRSANAKKKNLIQQQYEHEIEINHDGNQPFRQTIKQQNRPVIRQSFTPNDQQTIRQTIKNIDSDSKRNKDQNLITIEEEQQYPNQQQTNQLRESIKPVLTYTYPQQTISTPNNNIFYQ